MQIGVGKAICKDDKGNVFPESSCSHLTKPTTCGGASSPIGGSGVSVSTRATEMLIAVNCAMGLEKIEYSIQGQEQTSPLSVDYKYADRYFVKTPIKE